MAARTQNAQSEELGVLTFCTDFQNEAELWEEPFSHLEIRVTTNVLTERVGFEPTVRLNVHWISS
jgi:hypothetical protein